MFPYLKYPELRIVSLYRVAVPWPGVMPSLPAWPSCFVGSADREGDDSPAVDAVRGDRVPSFAKDADLFTTDVKQRKRCKRMIAAAQPLQFSCIHLRQSARINGFGT